jgi:hypothetical protein
MRHPRAKGSLCLVLLSSAAAGCGSRTGLDDALSESIDAARSMDCPDAARLIFVLTQAPSSDAHGQLLQFDPQTAAFSSAVTVPCLPPIQLPTALAVDRQGNAYIAGISIDRQVVRIDRATGTCQKPGLAASVVGFGMAFTGGAPGPNDELYAVDGRELEVVDPSTFHSVAVGPFGSIRDGSAMPDPYNDTYRGVTVYLTGNADGDVFALGSPDAPLGTRGSFPVAYSTSIGQVDKATGAVTDRWVVGVPDITPIWASGNVGGFAFWGSDFYFFVTSGSGTVVWRFRPSDASTQQVAQTEGVILAAGASTCAPISR